MSRSQDSKAAAIKDAASHAEFIAKSSLGNRPMPQSFPVRMQSSTLACTQLEQHQCSPAGRASRAARAGTFDTHRE